GFDLNGEASASMRSTAARPSSLTLSDSVTRSNGRSFRYTQLGRVCACPGSRRPANARAGKGGASAPEPRTKRAREHIRRSNQAKIRGAGEKRRILFGSHGNAEKALPGDKVIREGAFPRCAST